jgi:hypothetical protein
LMSDVSAYAGGLRRDKRVIGDRRSEISCRASRGRGDLRFRCELLASSGLWLVTNSASSGFLEQFAKLASSLVTIDLARRDIENELFPIVDRQFPVG